MGTAGDLLFHPQHLKTVCVPDRHPKLMKYLPSVKKVYKLIPTPLAIPNINFQYCLDFPILFLCQVITTYLIFPMIPYVYAHKGKGLQIARDGIKSFQVYILQRILTCFIGGLPVMTGRGMLSPAYLLTRTADV